MLLLPTIRAVRSIPRRAFLIIDGNAFLRVPVRLGARHLQAEGLVASRLRNVVVWFPLVTPTEVLRSSCVLMSGPPEGRLGNRIFELAIGLHVAALAGVEQFAIIHRPMDGDEAVFVEGLRATTVLGLTRVDQNRLLSENGSGHLRGRIIVQADFLNSFPPAIRDPDALASTFDELRASGFLRTSGHAPTQMVLHFRGTDRLSAPSSPQYSLAPVSYYVKACRLENVDRVVIVTDDPRSGIVLALVEQLGKSGVAARVQSKSLDEDLRTLMSAEVLVLAGSSLSDSVAGLSPGVRRIYHYEKKMWVRKDIEIIEIYDESGLYKSKLMAIYQDFAERANHLVLSFPEASLGARKVLLDQQKAGF